jgi:alanyl-tRNA synthetase
MLSIGDLLKMWNLDIKKKEFNRPIFFEGLPGIGNVGKVVVDYIIEQFEAEKIGSIYQDRYPEISAEMFNFSEIVNNEYQLFDEALKRGLKHANKILRKKRVPKISGEEAFLLASTYGLSPEVMLLNGIHFDSQEFETQQDRHKSVSRAGVEKKFGGHGLLLDNGEIKAANQDELIRATKLHSATHLLNTALRELFPDHKIEQRGSDITADRLRFDFTFDRRLTEEEFHKLQELINHYIQSSESVSIQEMSFDQAVGSGALYLQSKNYPKKVSVYSFGTISKEICGGPHVNNTIEIGNIILKKQESVAQGVRRIRATISSD